jgi:hypothetical protein
MKLCRALDAAPAALPVGLSNFLLDDRKKARRRHGVDDVAKRLGISRTAFYAYCPAARTCSSEAA